MDAAVAGPGVEEEGGGHEAAADHGGEEAEFGVDGCAGVGGEVGLGVGDCEDDEEDEAEETADGDAEEGETDGVFGEVVVVEPDVVEGGEEGVCGSGVSMSRYGASGWLRTEQCEVECHVEREAGLDVSRTNRRQYQPGLTYQNTTLSVTSIFNGRKRVMFR